MHLDLIHGLFITLTEFRLLTTFIPVIIIMHIYNWYHPNVTDIHYVHGLLLQYAWRNPLAFYLPLPNPFCSPFGIPFTYLEPS
jgi:hypothetical protein